jgi:hypothetical protein
LIKVLDIIIPWLKNNLTAKMEMAEAIKHICEHYEHSSYYQYSFNLLLIAMINEGVDQMGSLGGSDILFIEALRFLGETVKLYEELKEEETKQAA